MKTGLLFSADHHLPEAVATHVDQGTQQTMGKAEINDTVQILLLYDFLLLFLLITICSLPNIDYNILRDICLLQNHFP